jgi:hypothetical protein
MLKTVSSITNAVGALNFKGTWDANANSPALASSVGTKGDYYVVSTAGSTNLNGISNWGIGDWATYNGSVWQRVEGGADLNGVNLSVSGTSTLSGLTASTALALNASKEVVSVTNTGTGDNVLATSPTLVTPALGTPSSGVVTNLTGTASININGTVGATTPADGSFTTLKASSDVLFGASVANGKTTVEYSTASSNGIYCENKADNVDVGGACFHGNLSSGTGTNNTTAVIFRGRSAGADRFYVFGNGDVVNTNNSYGALSDVKLKENITDATPKLDKLNQVRIVNYNLIGEDRKQIGVIAQELEQIFPGLIQEHPDRDKDDNDLGTKSKSVKMSVFVPMLIKAMQEQQAIINALTARVSALESN